MRTPILAGALLVGSAAWAQEGLYVGGALGILDYEEELLGSFSDAAQLYRVYGGYRFGKRWALEGYYAASANLKDDPLALLPTVSLGTVRASFDIIEIRGLAHFGSFLLGMGYWDSDISESPSFVLWGPRNDPDYSVILGGEWGKDDWSFRLEAEVFDTDRYTDAAALSFGAHYRFGRREP